MEDIMKKLVLFSVLAIFVMVGFSHSAYDDTRVEKKIIVTSAKKATLGVVIKDLVEDDKTELKVEKGAIIEKVIEDSEAERIGLKELDVIVKFDGKVVKDAAELKDLVSQIEEEKSVVIEVVREGKEQKFTADLKPGEVEDIDVDLNDLRFDWGSDEDGLAMKLPQLPGMKKLRALGMLGERKGAFLGVNASNISKQMLEYFEVDYGVLVEEVIKDSPAEKAGLKAGDIITQIEDRKVEDFADLVRIMNYYNPEEKVKLHYTRKGGKKSVEVTLEKKRDSRFLPMRKLDGPDDSILQYNEEQYLPPRKDILPKKLPVLKERLEKLKNIEFRLFII
jgi:S1-C subfamily serine protease